MAYSVLGYSVFIWTLNFCLPFYRLQGLEEQYRKEKEEADQLFEQQRKVLLHFVFVLPGRIFWKSILLNQLENLFSVWLFSL